MSLMRIVTTAQVQTSPVVVTTTGLPGGTVGQAYSATLAASGGTGPYTWTGTGVPAGLTLSAAGVLSGTPTTAGSATVTVTATDTHSSASPATPLSLTINAGSVTLVDPLTLLPVPVHGVYRDWNNFPGKTWALNTPWSDNTTGVQITRLTNASSTGGGSCALEYSACGPAISQPMPVSGGGIQYWVSFSQPWIGLVTLKNGIVTMDQTSFYTIPIGYTAGLTRAFSQLPGEQDILYACDNGTSIHRYNVRTRAYAPNSFFTGSTASINLGINYPGNLTISYDGTRATFCVPIGNVTTTYYSLNLTTGVLRSYTGSPTSQVLFNGTCTGATTTTMTDSTRNWGTGRSNGQFAGAQLKWTSGVNNGVICYIKSSTATTVTFNSAMATASSPGDTYFMQNVHQLHALRGPTNAVLICDAGSAGNQGYVWLPDNGNKASSFLSDSYNTNAGHLDGFGNFWALRNLVLGNGGWQFITPGTAVANDGDPYNGTVSTYWGAPATGWTAWDMPALSDGHRSGNWNRLANGWAEYMTGDCYGNGPTSAPVLTWTVYSGSIYQTTSLTADPSCGINEVILWNQVIGVGSIYSGNLVPAASLAAMTAGTFYWAQGTGSAGILYCWMADSTTPANKVLCIQNSICSNSIYFCNQGTDRRRLCWQWGEPTDTTYERDFFSQISPDGRIYIAGWNLGNADGRVDLCGIAMPYQGP